MQKADKDETYRSYKGGEFEAKYRKVNCRTRVISKGGNVWGGRTGTEIIAGGTA